MIFVLFQANDLGSKYDKDEEVINEMKSRIVTLEKDLKQEQLKRSEESRLLAKQVAEKYNKVQELEASIEEYKGEISILKNKHAVTQKVCNFYLLF